MHGISSLQNSLPESCALNGKSIHLNIIIKTRLSKVIAYIDIYIFLLYPRGFVALCVQMSVAWANKVKGTMSLLLGTNEILASKHDIPKGQTRPGTLRPPS